MSTPELSYAAFRHTETWLRLSAVNGRRSQSAQRSSSVNPAIRAIRSNSAGQA